MIPARRAVRRGQAFNLDMLLVAAHVVGEGSQPIQGRHSQGRGETAVGAPIFLDGVDFHAHRAGDLPSHLQQGFRCGIGLQGRPG